MITLKYSSKNTPFVFASELHAELGITIPLAIWFTQIIAANNFKNKIDYYKLVESVAPGVDEWSVRLEMAKHITMSEQSERGKAVRDYLLFLESKRNEGELLTTGQVEVLMDIAEILGLFSIQKFLETEHHVSFLLNSKPYGWWDYRAKLFGVTVDDIKAIIAAYGISYENQRQALFHIDRYELVRRASIDLFKVMGKSDEYAINMGNTAKMLAKRLKVDVYNDLGMSLSFTNQKQNDIISQVRAYKNSPSLLSAFTL